MIKFTHSLSFCPQNIAKSEGQFSNMDRDLSGHWERFTHLHLKSFNCTWVGVHIQTSPVGHNQLHAPNFRGCVSEPCDGNSCPFIHPYSYKESRHGFQINPRNICPFKLIVWTFKHLTQNGILKKNGSSSVPYVQFLLGICFEKLFLSCLNNVLGGEMFWERLCDHFFCPVVRMWHFG